MKIKYKLLYLLFFFLIITCKKPHKLPDKIPSWGDIYIKFPYFAQGWKYIVIHHSGGNNGNAEIFHNWHTKKGYGGLAYHFVIGNGNGSGDGEIEEGFRWKNQYIGTHVTPDSWHHNIYGIGICLVGNFQKTKPTKKQLDSLVKLIYVLCNRHKIPYKNIMGHRDVPFSEIDWTSKKMTVIFDYTKHQKKSCPGKNFSVEYIKKEVQKLEKQMPLYFNN